MRQKCCPLCISEVKDTQGSKKENHIHTQWNRSQG